MAQIGCPILAYLAAKGECTANAQAKFRYLGSGVSRMAFEGPDGNVYKVPRYSTYQTDKEEEVFTEMRAVGIPWVPEITVWRLTEETQHGEEIQTVVTAMPKFDTMTDDEADELVDSDYTFLPERFDSVENRQRYNQMQEHFADSENSGNLGLDQNGLLVLIDGG